MRILRVSSFFLYILEKKWLTWLNEYKEGNHEKELFIVSLVLSMCFSMLSIVNVQAKETIREDHYVNPIYKDVKSSVVHHDIQTYSLEEVEYTSDQEKLVKIFREKLINRESNIVLYYHCDEEITQEFFF